MPSQRPGSSATFATASPRVNSSERGGPGPGLPGPEPSKSEAKRLVPQLPEGRGTSTWVPDERCLSQQSRP